MSNEQFLETNEYLANDNDVIAFHADSMCKVAVLKHKIYFFLFNHFPDKLIEFLEKEGMKAVRCFSNYRDSRGRNYNNLDNSKWLRDGKECEILQVGSNGWKKGKIRLKVSLEFIADEPEIEEIESPLDDIRQSINQS